MTESGASGLKRAVGMPSVNLQQASGVFERVFAASQASAAGIRPLVRDAAAFPHSAHTTRATVWKAPS